MSDKINIFHFLCYKSFYLYCRRFDWICNNYYLRLW